MALATELERVNGELEALQAHMGEREDRGDEPEEEEAPGDARQAKRSINSEEAEENELDEDNPFNDIPPEKMSLIRKAIEELQQQAEAERQKFEELDSEHARLKIDIETLEDALADVKKADKDKTIIKLRGELGELKKEKLASENREASLESELLRLREQLDELNAFVAAREGHELSENEVENQGLEELEAEEVEDDYRGNNTHEDLKSKGKLAGHVLAGAREFRFDNNDDDEEEEEEEDY
mgnify:FL=1